MCYLILTLIFKDISIPNVPRIYIRIIGNPTAIPNQFAANPIIQGPTSPPIPAKKNKKLNALDLWFGKILVATAVAVGKIRAKNNPVKGRR